ncbi:MAG: T9SS type A sorting domain-containing protein [Saprospiraceae bacterium]|nr:T9SS type A sorting domain-containing protein [Saprospiraceae bacterium]MDW8484066.1 T9SS type A sorting domain-containing protein [Saprospiraceae bacterium]
MLYRNILYIVLLCLLGYAVEAQHFQRYYGTKFDNAFTKVISHGAHYYVIGRDQPVAGAPPHAIVARIDSTGKLLWTLRLDIASQWNDAVLTPSGNLLVVGHSLPFDVNSEGIMGLVTPTGVFSWVNLYSVPGRDGFIRVVRNPVPNNPNFPYYVLGTQWEGGITSATWDDVALLTVSENGSIGWKKVYVSSADDEFARDLGVFSNGDLLLAGNIGTTGVLFRVRNEGDLLSRIGLENVSFTFRGVTPVSGGVLAVGHIFPAFQAFMMKFNPNLIPLWHLRLPSSLTAVHNVWQADSNIYVSGKAALHGIMRGTVLRFLDTPGPPVLRWMKFLYYNETAHSEGTAWPISNNRMAYTDGRAKPDGFGGESAFLSISNLELSTCITQTVPVTIAAVDFSFFFPTALNLRTVATPAGTNLLYKNILWEQAEACPKMTIFGTVYRECGNEPYTNQVVLPGWTVQLLDTAGLLVASQQTDTAGNYRFVDLPLQPYVVKVLLQAGWTANAPASGSYPLDGTHTSERRNFGVCPTCSCSDVHFEVAPVPNDFNVCDYALVAIGDRPYCFNQIDLQLSASALEIVELDNSWEAIRIDSHRIQLRLRGEKFDFSYFRLRVRKMSADTMTVLATYRSGSGNASCKVAFPIKCPPIPIQPCCPPGSQLGPQLVQNGNFALGNVGFTNSYTFVSPFTPMLPGNYSVLDATQIPAANAAWACLDHTTALPTGKMLVVDGQGPVAWQQTVTVTAGTTYAFSAWFNNLVRPPKNYSDPQVALFVNNIQIAGPLSLPETPDRWEWLCGLFTASISGPAVISIRMLSTAQVGNDVAIDDISFRACLPPPPTCVCAPNAFINMVYQAPNDPKMPIACGQSAIIWDCQLPAFNLSGTFVCQGNACPSKPNMFWTLTHPNLPPFSGTMSGPNFSVSIPNTSFLLPGLYTLTLAGICGQDTCRCVILIETRGCVCGCYAKVGVLFDTAGTNTVIPCNSTQLPVFPCPSAPVTIVGGFGCVNPSDALCPVNYLINWTLYGPTGIIQNGSISTGIPWALTFTPADLAGSGLFTLYMSTLCPGQVDSCRCVVRWFQECIPPCRCGPNPWNLTLLDSSGQGQTVNCGSVLNVTPGSVFLPTFICQGPSNCGKVDWVLTGPNGYFQSMMGVVPNASGSFVIPPLSPINFSVSGTYSLQLVGICGQDTCRCVVHFCLPPSMPYLNDTSICRTLSSAYIPLQNCPTNCNIAQVQWFIKPCSSNNWPPIPYQISSAGNPQNCDDLLFLPYQYPNEACVQVYAVIKLDPGCCLPDVTTNVATIHLCNPISCTINNPNLGFCQTGQPLSLTGVLNGANCNHTVEWYDENSQLVGTGLTYQPPVLTFPTGSTACYKDFTYTMKVIGVCGASSCSTTIRVFNINSDNGDLQMVPAETQPFCPGEDARLVYLDKCSGPPPKWQWYSSTVSATSGFTNIPGTGTMNPIYYTNQLYQTTWFMVESQNGTCPPQQDILKIDVKDPIKITSFTAIPDPCITKVTLTVGFTPSPIAGPGCQYVVEWFHNGNLIHTSVASSSPVSYTYVGPSVWGIYYAVVRDNCCPAAVQTWSHSISEPCMPVILGPCYKCDVVTPATLYGEMILPPQDNCPPNVGCTYQWYVKDVQAHPDVWVPLPGQTNPTLTILQGGHYKLETTCNYGYGSCLQCDSITIAQCKGCIYVGEEEIPLPTELAVAIQPNPTTGEVNVQISPMPLRRGRIEVLDINGRRLVSKQIPEGHSSVMVSLAALPSGLYLVRVYEGEVLLWMGKVIRSQ